MAHSFLRPIFSSVLLGHFGVAVALAGCGSSGDGPAGDSPAGGGGQGGSPPVVTGDFGPFSCYPALPGAAATLGLDSIELWQVNKSLEGGEEKVTFRSLTESDGEACAGALGAPCLSSLERARNEPSPEGFGFPESGPERSGSSVQVLITTAGGDVRLVDNHDELAALLGPIDAPEKARILVYFSRRMGCALARRTDAGFEIVGESSVGDCPIRRQTLRVLVTPAGKIETLEIGEPQGDFGCAGRRPAGLSEQSLGSGEARGRYLERQAYLEAASVEAFERFALELEALGAPAELVADARRARADEVRHHALLVALGRRFDPSFTCQAPEATPAAPRSPFAFALENAVEGCVRETWGALLAHHQAARAADGAVRFVSAVIADDETRHAELAWATHRWLLGRLDAAERRAIEAGVARAIDGLRSEIAAGDVLAPHEREQLGLPSADEARALLARLDGALWAEAWAA